MSSDYPLSGLDCNPEDSAKRLGGGFYEQHLIRHPDTGDGKLGNSTQSSSQQTTEQSNRASTLDAGNDINISAGNGVTIQGSQLQAGRDIAIKGRDITLDVAKGGTAQQTSDSQSWGGVHGGSSGGFKVGIGGSHGTAGTEGNQGSSTASNLDAGRDVKLDAGNDLNIVGSQVHAGRDIDLAAGNDITIRAAQNDSEHEQNRASGGGEVGLAFGSEGVGIYASVNLGKGHLEREAQRHQEAYLYAGDQLKFTSGKDTTISGAQVRGDEVIGRVGGDLNVSSAIDTGEVKGKEFDVSVTVTIGPGAGVSGSVGYGQTTGKTEWVENQTRVTGASNVDIRTGSHTQIDGALIAADNGNLKLDTGTLGYSDIAGSDKEHGYYLNVGGSWKQGSGSTQQDASQEGKGKKGENGWSVSGWEYEKDREQIVRATVGEGEIVVRGDAETGQDSTAGLNRDLDKAYEITRDHEERTDLYITDSSLHDVMNPTVTLDKWVNGLLTYHETALQNFEQAGNVVNTLVNRYERLMGRPMDSGAVAIAGKQLAEETMEGLILAGIAPDKAKALMADEQFQKQVLQQLKNLEGLFEESQKIADQLESSKDALQLATTHVNAERSLSQWTGSYASTIAQYIDQHPAEGEKLTLALAMIQGPKAIIQLAVGSVISETQAGQKVGEYVDVARTFLGKVVAEHLEGAPLNGGEDDGSEFLIGGGKLIFDVLTGAVSGSKGGKKNTVPTAEASKGPSEHIAQNSKGSDSPSKQPETSASEHGPCCFAAGTMVATPSGDRAIETLKVGDVVWSKPEHGGKPFAAAILQTHQRNDQPIYKLTLESTRTDVEVKQETLFVTPSHPFYVPAQRDFVPMIELKAGDLLQSLGDGEGEGTSSRVASVELYKPVGETFNLTVDIGHTFYVGELKTWVHNTGPCDIDGGPKQPDVQGEKVDGAESQVPVDKWSREPKSLQDEMTLQAAKEGQGVVIIEELNDPKFKGMQKIELKTKSSNGQDSVVHYVRDPKTGELMDFKFKKHSVD